MRLPRRSASPASGSTWAWRAITLLAAGVLGAGVAVAFVGPERQVRRDGGDSPPAAPAPGESAGDLTGTDTFGESGGFVGESGFGETDFGETDGFSTTDGFSETDFGETDAIDDAFVLPGELDDGFQAESEP